LERLSAGEEYPSTPKQANASPRENTKPKLHKYDLLPVFSLEIFKVGFGGIAFHNGFVFWNFGGNGKGAGWLRIFTTVVIPGGLETGTNVTP
jgi:hypothetical protein